MAGLEKERVTHVDASKDMYNRIVTSVDPIGSNSKKRLIYRFGV